jgi:predicted metal-dependent peptidase
VGADTSGSIGKKELDMFFAEVAGILEEVKPKRLFIMWCDAAVHDVDECEDASDLMRIRRKGVRGGGGTSFIPVFEEIAKRQLEPDALIYLTDLAGSFPNKPPKYDCIWGTIIPGSKAPFGDTVEVPKQA